jgi:hypothetical protein
MPDQKGMPIWDKMYVVETETATGLMIPLSYDDETMSSVLFATLDGKNTVTGVRDYDNATLEDIVYNQKISVENRESLFLSFMHMDNRTFGNEQFIGIPKDLFVGKKSDDEYGVLWVRDFAPSSSVTTQEAGKLMIIETCFIALHCTHHGAGLCDAEQGCTECGTTFCTYEVIGTADNPFPSTGGGGGGLAAAVEAEMHRGLMYRQTLVVLEIRVLLSIGLCLVVVEVEHFPRLMINVKEQVRQ